MTRGLADLFGFLLRGWWPAERRCKRVGRSVVLIISLLLPYAPLQYSRNPLLHEQTAFPTLSKPFLANVVRPCPRVGWTSFALAFLSCGRRCVESLTSPRSGHPSTLGEMVPLRAHKLRWPPLVDIITHSENKIHQPIISKVPMNQTVISIGRTLLLRR